MQLIGINLNWGLMGILFVQLYIYGYSFPNDPKFIKSLVFGLGVLEAIQTILATLDGYHWFAAGFGNVLTLNEPYISAFDSPFLDSIISLVVQFFFAYRIWVLTRSYLPVAAVVLGPEWQLEFRCGLLELLRSRSTLSNTNHTILRLVRITIETNSLTAGVAVLSLILFLSFRDQPTLNVPSAYVLGKLYTNTFLAMLNNRLLIAKDAKGVVSKFEWTFAVLPAMNTTALLSANSTKKSSRQHISVEIIQTQTLSVDPEMAIPLDELVATAPHQSHSG
ncbi:hypothetical protein JR316_0008557 [Psilocybe cubensis]|uniref:Uncharacterized protein n=1 Tax=Psilocybe cubensis TaxID=181762 RepID=A0ACB8GYB4_PSICU|nr:hypothetical protein JR316_0008557 [Psilocybe cubensis]KAH9479960.1 hypothetical protein JR316_0008557 [Psilocybe cubensis]